MEWRWGLLLTHPRRQRCVRPHFCSKFWHLIWHWKTDKNKKNQQNSVNHRIIRKKLIFPAYKAKTTCENKWFFWRRRRDSNSRTVLPVTRFPIVRPRPTRRLLQIVFCCLLSVLSLDCSTILTHINRFVNTFFEKSLKKLKKFQNIKKSAFFQKTLDKIRIYGIMKTGMIPNIEKESSQLVRKLYRWRSPMSFWYNKREAGGFWKSQK